MAKEDQAIRDWIREGLETKGHGAKGTLAKILNLHPSQVTRIIDGQRRIQAVEMDRLIKFFSSIPPVPSFVDEALKRMESPESASEPVLSEYDIRAGAAYGGGGDTSEAWNETIEGEHVVSAHKPVAKWGLPSSFVEKELGLTYGFADILQIQGDSMDDGSRYALLPGDRVIVDRRHTDPRQGGIFAVWDGEGVIVKQVELVRGAEPVQILCKSLNRRYDPFALTIDGNVHVIGRIAGRISRM